MSRYIVFLILLLVIPLSSLQAQEAVPSVESTSAPRLGVFQLDGFRFEYQGWNNCGPATLTNALTFFGYTDNQTRAAQFLKPNGEDKNVTPQEMIGFVNSQVPEMSVFALTRMGGTLDLLKTLLANEFPVIIEAGYNPPPGDLGWMGHYLLLVGYDDAQGQFITMDSYEGPNYPYTYDHVNENWRHFNRTYIVLYESGREPELLQLLGSDADATQNALNALEIARNEATVSPQDPFAWFNIGTSYVALAPAYKEQAYEYAAAAYDEARKFGLPWRMMWYQFGPLEAYNAVGRFDDTLTLTNANLNDGGGQWVEETFFYRGAARELEGDPSRALENYQQALFLNRNYDLAQEAVNRLQSQASS